MDDRPQLHWYTPPPPLLTLPRPPSIRLRYLAADVLIVAVGAALVTFAIWGMRVIWGAGL